MGVNLCQSVDNNAKDAKGNAKVAKECKGRQGKCKDAEKAKSAKKNFFCVLCKLLCFLWFFIAIGVNLCQSVDGNAKDAKGTKDAKELTQRRRETQRRKETILCSL